MTNQQPECPECEKLAKVSKESDKIGDFLDWLHQNGATICEWDNRREEYYKSYDYNNIQKVLSLYFNIDLDKVEKERRALLEWIRKTSP
jgi:hypothetical protein